MPWRKPTIPQQLTSGFIVSNLSRRQKRELAQTLKAPLDELQKQFRTIPWNKLEMRDLMRLKQIKTFDRDVFEQMFDEAREVIDNDCSKLAEETLKIRDQILEIEKNESDDGKGTKELLLEIAEKAELFSQQLSKEALEEHLQELRNQHMEGLNKQLEIRFTQLKKGLVQIVEKIKKAKEADFSAGAESTLAVTYGYTGVQPTIKDYINYAEKGIGDLDGETVKQELEPLSKFSGDSSLFTSMVENDELERKAGAIVTGDTDSEEIKKHCITILQAVRALPSRYKE
jgi:hypothetical protein